MGDDLAVTRELEFAAHETICQFAWFDGERGNVPRQFGRILRETLAEHHLENPATGFISLTVDQGKQVWFHANGNRGRRGEREMDTGDVDPGGAARGILWLESVDEEGAENLHGRRLHLLWNVVPATLSESASKDVLRAFGFPLCREVVASSWDEIEGAARGIGYPLVLKANAPTISHKSELGLVVVDIRDDHALRRAHGTLVERLAGQPADFLVAEMVRGRRELIVGLNRDADFGDFALIGLGGVAAEALEDVQLVPLPATEREVTLAFERLRSRELFGEFRGLKALRSEDLARAVMALAALAEARPDISSVDVNPMIVTDDGRLTAVDALVVVDEVDEPARRERSDRTGVLRAMFDPRAVVVLGASTHPGKFGFVSLHNILVNGFRGSVFGFNQSGDQVLGATIVTSLADLPDDGVDLAFFCTPAVANEELLRQCAERGVKAAFVASAGYRELGEQGAEQERRLAALADQLGMVLGGPNGQGVVSTPSNLCAQIVAPYPQPGGLSIASQSGNFVSSFLNLAKWSHVGVARAVSAGNSAHCDVSDYLRFYASDEHTRVSLAYVESVDDGARFMETVRLHAATKPLVLIKGGRTDAGQHAASSHTGALASNSAAFEARATQSGAVVVEEPESAFDTAAAFASLPLPFGPRLVILTTVGGWGVVTCDVVGQLENLRLADLSTDLVARLDEFMPPRWSRSNPIDCAGGETRDTVTTAIEVLCASGEVDALLLLGLGIQGNQARMMAQGGFSGDPDLARIVAYHERQETRYVDAAEQAMKTHGIPVALATEIAVADTANAAIRRAHDRSLYVFPTGPRAVRALDRMARYGAYRKGSR